ncbi:hypothetical protein QC762_404195 [Podospora pseudocomata]|uniref:Rhodopsin domain-containing protein n=1 Tax=Podospora pseudocomata TaxID=2093779 RepID=A0ABR0GHD8_9PEZI|nr:hypothetical protein QC762_404195 [Podospora pseudocomata]
MAGRCACRRPAGAVRPRPRANHTLPLDGLCRCNALSCRQRYRNAGYLAHVPPHLSIRHKAFNIQLIVVGALVFGWGLAGTIASVFNCVPVEEAWELPINDERYCYNYNIVWLVMGIFEVILNIMILGLRMASLRKLNIPLANKLSAGRIFFLRGFVVVTGIVKVVLGYVPTARNPNQFKIVLWATLHLTTAIICATLPIMNPMLRQIRKSRTFQLVAGNVFSKTWKSRTNNENSISRVNDGKAIGNGASGSDQPKTIPLDVLGGKGRDRDV